MNYVVSVQSLIFTKDVGPIKSLKEKVHDKRIIKGAGGDHCRNKNLADVARDETQRAGREILYR